MSSNDIDPKFLYLSESEVRTDLNLVKYLHDSEAADRLIRCFFLRIQQGELHGGYLDLLLEYVEYGLTRILFSGKTADVGFGLKPGRGEYQRNVDIGRNIRLAAIVERIRRDGASLETACAEAAREFSEDSLAVSVETAARAYSQYRSILQDGSITKVWLDSLREP